MNLQSSEGIDADTGVRYGLLGTFGRLSSTVDSTIDVGLSCHVLDAGSWLYSALCINLNETVTVLCNGNNLVWKLILQHVDTLGVGVVCLAPSGAGLSGRCALIGNQLLARILHWSLALIRVQSGLASEQFSFTYRRVLLCSWKIMD